MPTYTVETCLLVQTKIKVLVQAADKAAALNAAAELLPSNHDMSQAAKWKADVKLKAPKGVVIESTKAVHFEQTSGGEKVRFKSSFPD